MIIVFDLDDTLYDEIDFVYSGYKEIANFLDCEECYDFMIDIFKQNGSGKVFNALINHYKLDISLDKLISIYRYHKPNISLNNKTVKLLNFANRYTCTLISDGDYLMQSNKFEALKLDEFIKDPIFTDYYHTKKPELKSFEMVMQRYRNEKYLYISDNPKKDFIAPKKLSWYSIRYKNPVGIYKDIANSADFETDDRLEIIDIIKGLI